jgi:hypothetical protein
MFAGCSLSDRSLPRHKIKSLSGELRRYSPVIRIAAAVSLPMAVPREPDQKEDAMKLTAARVDRTLSQFEAMPLPEDHPAIAQLNQLFGEHTFFLTVSGLHVVEPAETPDEADPTGQVVKLASWGDSNRTSLVPHEPEPTEVVVVLGDTE